ncbi:MAG: hypothetical protein QXW91_02280 [Candidatus Nitrosotenuis sp.]
MQTRPLQNPMYKYLLFSLMTISGIVIVTNLLGHSTANSVGYVMYGVLPAIPLVLALLNVQKFRMSGKHGFAWIIFAGALASRFIAEQLWTVYDKVFEIDPWPSEADFFYLLFYGLFAAFSILYLKPFMTSINRKKIVVSIAVSVAIFAPTMFHMVSIYEEQWEVKYNDIIIGMLYPISDSIVIIPTVIALMLFFEGKVNFFWSAIFVGILCLIVSDTLFLMEEIDSTYEVGHPLDIGYFSTYVLFSFGLYHNMKVFTIPKSRFRESDLR